MSAPASLDHLMWAGRDLDAAIATFAQLSGVTARLGGVHKGLATRNALTSLGNGVYFEIIAPDPEQPQSVTLADIIRQLARPQLLRFIVRGKDLAAMKKAYEKVGVACEGPFTATRLVPDGKPLQWQLLVPEPNRFGMFAPTVIDWMDSPHPSTTAIAGCVIESFEMGTPDVEELGDLYRSLGLDIVPVRADAGYLRAVIATPKGRLVLTSA